MGKKSLARNTIYKTILNICNIIVPIIVGPYILRILDREYYDLFNTLNANFSLFLAIGGFGIYAYGVREVSRVRGDQDKVNKLFSELFYLGILTNFIVMGVYLPVAICLQDADLKVYICLILSIQFLGNMFNVEWVNEANENYGFIALKSIIIRILYFIAIFIFVQKANDIIAYVLILILSTFLNTFFSFIYIKRTNKLLLKGLNFKKHLFPLFVIFIISNVSILYAQVDKIMLGAFVSESSVSSYQIAQFISSLIYSLLIPVVVVSVPKLSKLFVSDKERCFTLHSKVFNAFLMLGVPSLVGATLMAKEIVLLYGGSVYLDCVEPLMIYCAAQLISSGCYIFGDAFLYVTGNEKRLLINNLIGGLLNVSLNFLFVALGIFNSNLAVLTIVIAYAVVSILDYIFIRRKIGYKLKILNRHSLLYIGASALFVPIGLLVHHFDFGVFVNIAIMVPSCIVIYFGLLFIFKDSIFRKFVFVVVSKGQHILSMIKHLFHKNKDDNNEGEQQ